MPKTGSAAKPSEVLRKAKAVIQERGWHQGGYAVVDGENIRIRSKFCSLEREGRVGSVCAEGAIIVAALDLDDINGALMFLEQETQWDVPGWNDEEGMTKEEVFDAFDRAIDRAKASEALDA